MIAVALVVGAVALARSGGDDDVSLEAGAPTSAAPPPTPAPTTTDWVTTTMGPPPTSSAPPPATSPPDLRIEPLVMPDLVGLPDIESAHRVLEVVCGGRAPLHPTPAWDPTNPVDLGTILHQLPAPGTQLDDDCTHRGTTLTVFSADEEYCTQNAGVIALGWCPLDPDAPPPTDFVPPTTAVVELAPPGGPVEMPDLVGLPFETATAMLLDLCGGLTAGFPSPAWDPANPAETGTVIHQEPQPGALLDTECLTTDGELPGTTPTLFVADEEYCTANADVIGLGWCPRR